MYKLINIIESAMTREIELENITTGTVDKCFDDSAMKTLENFDFMEISEKYDCKILLFGNRVTKLVDDNSVKCKVIQKVKVGERELLEVYVNEDIYYINESSDDDCLFFNITRKDIIQVNNIVHYDMLKNHVV